MSIKYIYRFILASIDFVKMRIGDRVIVYLDDREYSIGTVSKKTWRRPNIQVSLPEEFTICVSYTIYAQYCYYCYTLKRISDEEYFTRLLCQ